VPGQRGDEADDGPGQAQANRDEIGVGRRRPFRQPIDAPADLFDHAPALERIELVTADAARNGLAHAQGAAAGAQEMFEAFPCRRQNHTT
jgi:hypothetical protein